MKGLAFPGMMFQSRRLIFKAESMGYTSQTVRNTNPGRRNK
jgi:hypothetical protein